MLFYNIISMNLKIHSIKNQFSIIALALIIAGIPTLFENVLAQQDGLGEQQQQQQQQQQQNNSTDLLQGQRAGEYSTDNGISTDNAGFSKEE
jgi:hypothetical protein